MAFPLIKTPNLDWLSQHGVRFTNSFVANSLSGPSRACMLTGKHSYSNGFTDKIKRFDGSQQTYPKLLQKAGYETAIVGKWHLSSNPTGFDYWNILIGQGEYYNPDFIDNGKRVRLPGYVTNITTDLTSVTTPISLSVCSSITRHLIVFGCPTHVIWMPSTTAFTQCPRPSTTTIKVARQPPNRK